MPYTLNGIGAWYWGKRNMQSRMGTCDSCGGYGELKSYDTTLYFVILFLPVIPLGRKHIIDECPACRRHRVIALRQYKEERHRDMTEAIKAMKDAPGDAGKTSQALRCMVSYQDRQAFEALAARAPGLFPRDADLLALTAEGYMFFGKNAEAEAVWRQALQAKESTEFRQRMALSILRQLRPQDAEPLLAHITVNRDRETVGYLYLLAQGYQATAAHNKALAVLDSIEAAWPELAKDKEHKKHRKAVERHKRSGKALAAGLLQTPKMKSRGSDWTGRLAKVFLPVLLVALAVGYLVWCASIGRSRPVWVLNGTVNTYSVFINGREVSLPVGAQRQISLPEGTWQIKPGAGAAEIEPDTATFRCSFLARPFVRPTLVLNPDRVAILAKESTVYSTSPDPNAVMPYSVYCGRTFYEFKGVDYPFREFPKTISLDSSTSRLTKTRVVMLPMMDIGVVVTYLKNELGEKACAQYAARRACYEPDEGTWLFVFMAMAAPDKVMELVRPRLSARPVLVEWHRVYQTLMEKDKPEHDLVAEYSSLVEREPKDPHLQYLLGRISKPVEAAERLFVESEQCGDEPIGYGYHAIAFSRLCAGEFVEAFDFAGKALAVRPDVLQFQSSWTTAAMGARKFDDLLAAAEAKRAEGDNSISLLIQEYHWLCALGRSDDAERRLSDYERTHGGEFEPLMMETVKKTLRAHGAYMAGKPEEYARVAAEMPEAEWKFAAAITMLDAQNAAARIAEMEDAGYTEHLLVYVAAKVRGNDELAKRHWASALALMKDIDLEEDVIEALTAGDKIDPQTFLELHVLPDEKRIVLTAVGLAYPEHREALFALAKKLNVSVAYPRAFIDKVVSGET